MALGLELDHGRLAIGTLEDALSGGWRKGDTDLCAFVHRQWHILRHDALYELVDTVRGIAFHRCDSVVEVG